MRDCRNMFGVLGLCNICKLLAHALYEAQAQRNSASYRKALVLDTCCSFICVSALFEVLLCSESPNWVDI